jgi:hypothetical protein
MKAENQKNFKNCSQQKGLSLYFQLFCFITLTLLEPSTSHTLHYAVPLSLCRWTLTRGFAAPLKLCRLWEQENFLSVGPPCIALRRLTRHPLAVSPWEGSLVMLCSQAAFPSEDFLTIRSLSCRGTSPSLPARRLTASPWGEPPIVSLLRDKLFLLAVRRWLIKRCFAPRMFDTPPDNAIRYFLSKKREDGSVSLFNSKALILRNLLRQRLHRLHTARRYDFPLQYVRENRIQTSECIKHK